MKKSLYILMILCFIIFSCSSPKKEIKKVLEDKPSVLKPLKSLDNFFTDDFKNEKEIMKKFGLGSKFISYHIVRVKDGKVIKSKNAHKPFIPASTAKILTGIFALKVLGPNFRYKTTINYTGKIKNGILHGDIILVGDGDPNFHYIDIYNLAVRLKTKGITKVNGNFYFDDSKLLNLQLIEDDQADYFSYNQPISALSLNFNNFNVFWNYDPYNNEVSYYKYPFISPEIEVDQNQVFNKRNSTPFFQYQDGWTFPQNFSEYRNKKVRLPMKNPSMQTSLIFREVASQIGITLNSPQRLLNKKVLSKSKVFVVHKSSKLVDLTRSFLIHSNNMMTELVLLKAATKLNPKIKTLEQAANTMKWWLSKRYKLKTNKLKFVNGSGLSTDYRLSSKFLSSLLRKVSISFFDQNSFESLLPFSGMTGTLKRRFVLPQMSFKIQAKTGTMFYVSCLSGYMWSLNGERYAFTLMVNDLNKRKKVNKFVNNMTREKEAIHNRWIRNARKFQDYLVSWWVKSI